MSLVKRIPAHLKNVHHLDADSSEYREALSRVRGPVKESYMKPYHERPRVRSPNLSSRILQEVVLIEEKSEEQEDQNYDNASSNQSLDAATTPKAVFQFETWLKSADGGNLDEGTSKQHRVQLSKILKVVDKTQDLASLFNKQVINKKFLEGYAKREYHPKTTKVYLMSLRHFYSFCLSEYLGLSISADRLLSLKEKVARWSSSLRKGCSKRRWEKMEEDLHSLISPEQIGEFERSKAARDAICLLGQLSGAHSINITQSQYTLIRDFLLVERSIDNANTAGALSNMKLVEFNRVSKHGQEHVVLVKNHKTIQTHGPARIVLSPKLHSWIDIFIREVRSKVPGLTAGPNESVFITWNGETMESSQINKAIKSIWKKAGMERSPSSTLFRKSAVSEVHTNNESNEARGNLADLMAHNLETARKYYRLQEKSKSSVQASRNLRQAMRGTSGAEGSNDQPKCVPTSNSSLTVSDDDQSKTSRDSWTYEIKGLLREVFKNEIEKEAVSMEKNKMSNHPQLKGQDPKKVLDKVRTEWRFRKLPPPQPTSVPDLPTEKETLQERVQRALNPDVEDENSSDIIPPTLGSSLRGAFSSIDLDRLRALFNDMITKSFPIVKTKIMETLQTDDAWGKEILKRVPLDTIVNRVKYERRVSRASK